MCGWRKANERPLVHFEQGAERKSGDFFRFSSDAPRLAGGEGGGKERRGSDEIMARATRCQGGSCLDPPFVAVLIDKTLMITLSLTFTFYPPVSGQDSFEPNMPSSSHAVIAVAISNRAKPPSSPQQVEKSVQIGVTTDFAINACRLAGWAGLPYQGAKLVICSASDKIIPE